MSIRSAASETLALMERRGLRTTRREPPWLRFHPWYGRASVIAMLSEIVDGKIQGSMAHRNLGWAHCAICVHDGATAEELADINVEHIKEE